MSFHPVFTVDNQPSTPPRNISSHSLSGVNRGHAPPPNSPSSDFSRPGSPRPRQEGIVTNFNLTYTVDLRAITYVGLVDENLICPICRCALINPITTECDHTFCRECILDSLSHSPICPVDRSDLPQGTALDRSPKIVINQLDNLKSKCPCCDLTLPRSMIKHHLEKYCMEASVKCAGINTEKRCKDLVQRKRFEEGCLHNFTTCPDCQGIVWQIDMEKHREESCRDRHSLCGHCEADIIRCKKSQHDESCPEVVVRCHWEQYGCHFQAKRHELQDHTEECSFKLVGPMAEMLKNEISALQSEVRTLHETNQVQERRIKFLEKGPQQPDRMLEYSQLGHQISTFPEPSSADSPEATSEYLLSLLEAHEGKVSQLSADMTELDSKQTVMLLNETLPIKNELAEIRSNLQVTSMHVRWLMRFRIQENQRRFGQGSGPGPNSGSDGGGSSNDSAFPRRLSDTMRELVTKL